LAELALDSSRKVIGKIVFASFKNQQRFLFAYSSELSNGEILATANQEPQFSSPAGCTVFRRIGATAAQTMQLHQSKLAEREQNNPAKTINGLDQVAALEDKNLRMSFEDKTSRGAWVEMAESEIEALSKQRGVSS